MLNFVQHNPALLPLASDSMHYSPFNPPHTMTSCPNRSMHDSHIAKPEQGAATAMQCHACLQLHSSLSVASVSLWSCCLSKHISETSRSSYDVDMHFGLKASPDVFKFILPSQSHYSNAKTQVILLSTLMVQLDNEFEHCYCLQELLAISSELRLECSSPELGCA